MIDLRPRRLGFTGRLPATVVVLVVVALLGAAARSVTLDQDPVRALADPDPVRARLFEEYQTKNPLQGKVFVEAPAQDAASRAALGDILAAGGYQEVSLFQPPPPSELVSLAALLPAEEVNRLLADDAIRRRAAEVAELASLPGTGALLELVAADPLGLAQPVAVRLFPAAAAAGGGSSVRVFRREGPLDYERVASMTARLEAIPGGLQVIGGDLFALENYRAVQHDIVVNSVLSLLLNLVIFYGFTRRWALLGLLFLGSVVSYLTGLLSTWLFYAEIQGVVLAYTSTFVGFNNESLVHLAGIEEQRKRTTLLGIWSAIGTTVIGFLVLLAGHSTIVRQMALASLGGMAGFLLFLLPYRSTIAAVRFSSVAVRPLTIPPWILVLGCALAVGGIGLVGVPRIGTRIDDFRYETPALVAAIGHYQQRLDRLSLEDVVAVPCDDDPGTELAQRAERGELDLSRHPLKAWRPVTSQEETIGQLRARAPAALALLASELAAVGLRLPLATPAFQALDAWAYLERVGSLGPVSWTATIGGRRYVMAALHRDSAGPLPGGLAPVTPRRYYNTLLTSLSRELGWLFLAGLAAMATYLAALQKTPTRVLYVFAPLILAGLAFAGWARLTGTSLSIIHVMGFSLVIALAMDYTAVAISSDHAREETSKVLLTGLSTLATFGVLAFARHPVLRDLGFTVLIGCGLSLVFALFVRVAPPKARPS